MTDYIGPYELNSIIAGDARELAKAIPDESVDLIFTDPVYDRIDDYRWLAETAARVLKPNSAALVWGQTDLVDRYIEALKSRLSFNRILTLFMSGVTVGSFVGRVFIKTSPCLWMQKGESKPNRMMWDISIGVSNASKYGDHHEWGKDPATVSRWVESFSDSGAIIFDPFTGGGTVPAVCKMLRRRYLAFEIDPGTAERARERVRNTQPPLFVLQPEQSVMELSA